MIESRPIEKCYYCNKNAEFNQLVGEPDNYIVSGVCKDHFVMGLSS